MNWIPDLLLPHLQLRLLVYTALAAFPSIALAEMDQSCQQSLGAINRVSLSGISANRQLTFEVCSKERCGILVVPDGRESEILLLAQRPSLSIESNSQGHGEKIVASVVEKGGHGEQSSQIALINVSQRTMEIVTSSPELKYFPVMHSTLPMILYAAPKRHRERGVTRFSDWDIFELDLTSGRQTQLTHFEFFLVSAASYANNMDVIFSGDAPDTRLIGAAKLNTLSANLNQSHIYRYDRRAQQTTIAFSDVHAAIEPRTSGDGEVVVYVVRAKDLSKDRKFQYVIVKYQSNKHQQLTQPMPIPKGMQVSLDGKYVAFQQGSDDIGKPLITILDASSGRVLRSTAFNISSAKCLLIDEVKHASWSNR